jgi:hypothetical protein
LKDNIYEKLERVLHKFPKYGMKILFEDVNAEVDREDTFKPTTGNDSLHEISNDNEVGTVNSPTSKNLIIRSTMFHKLLHSKIYLEIS